MDHMQIIIYIAEKDYIRMDKANKLTMLHLSTNPIISGLRYATIAASFWGKKKIVGNNEIQARVLLTRLQGTCVSADKRGTAK